jgi:hypothetical protein
MRTALRFLAKAALGAAGGALSMVLVGRVVSLYAHSCTVVCQPGVAAKLGALSGVIAVFVIKGYEPG